MKTTVSAAISASTCAAPSTSPVCPPNLRHAIQAIAPAARNAANAKASPCQPKSAPATTTRITSYNVCYTKLLRDERALTAFRAAVALNPHLTDAGETIRRLAAKVEGFDI